MQIDYAPSQRPPWRQRLTRALRWLMVLICIAGVGFIAWQVIQRAELLRLQKECSRYTEPPTNVVYEYSSVDRSGSQSHVISTSSSLSISGPPSIWNKLNTWYSSSSRGNAFVFLHELHTRNKPPVLVVVEYGSLMLDCNVYSMGTWLRAPALLKTTHFSVSSAGNRTMYAGQIDPGNPAHFTIAVVQRGVHHRIHGYLDESDKVEFEWEQKNSAE